MEEEKKNPVGEAEEAFQTAETVNESETLSAEDLHGESLTDRVKVLSPTKTILKRFFRSKLSMVGLVTLIILFLFSFVGPIFSQWYSDGAEVVDTENIKEVVSPNSIEFKVDGETYIVYDIIVDTPTANIKGDITGDHWLGTDERGLDILTRLMLGGRVSLTIGFFVVIIQTILGVILGGLAGYFGGWVDQVIMRIVDILYCIPQIPIMLILSSVFSFETSILKLYYIMGILCLIGWAGTARIVRGQILSLREQEFMLAAKCSGLSAKRKIFKHLIPNVMPQLIVSMTLGLGSIILTEATLGFLGLGAPLGTATWGAMINYATKSEYMTGYLNFWLPAGICITLAILAFNFVGDGLRDAFDPKMKR